MKKLHMNAVKTAKEFANAVGVEFDKLDSDSRTFWFLSYPQVCESLGIIDVQDSAHKHDYALSNGDIFEEQENLFVLSVFAVNGLPGEMDDFFWVDFSFYPENAKIEVGATDVHASICDALFKEITGLDSGSVISHEEAFHLAQEMMQKLQEDKDAYRGIFEEYV
ncbi:MAG: hypothetical protein K9M36_03220 [Candidatus Pacebacteria bacterium]|nr:hypothetical protein [Candidatus Paceibacterota bacterium]